MIWAEIELQSETGHGRWRSHHGPWPSWKQREAAKGALELGLALRWAELDLTDPVNAVAEHSSSRASSKQRRWGVLVPEQNKWGAGAT